MDVLERLRQRLMYLVSRARTSLVDDAGPVQLLQCVFGGGWVQDKLPRMAQYGFQSVPPAGTDAVVLFLGGNPADGVVIATGHHTWRLKNMGAGEMAISDDKGQKVYLSAGGIRIEGNNLPIGITTTGDITVSANKTTFNGQVWANGKRIDEQHKHTGGTLSGLTGVPT